MLVAVDRRGRVGDAAGVGGIDLETVDDHVLGDRRGSCVGGEEDGGDIAGRCCGEGEVSSRGKQVGRTNGRGERGDVGTVEVDLDGGHGHEGGSGVAGIMEGEE